MQQSRKWIIILVTIILGVTLLGGCRPKQPSEGIEEPPVEEPQENNEEREEIPEEGEEPIPDENSGIHPGNPAPAFKLENKAGKTISLSQYRGKTTVVTFWVSWNEQAVEQLNILENVSPLVKENVNFVGIHASAFDSLNIEEALDKIRHDRYSYEILIDKDAEAQQAFYVGSFPTTFIIDPDGNIYRFFTTMIKEDQLLDELEEILEKFLP